MKGGWTNFFHKKLGYGKVVQEKFRMVKNGKTKLLIVARSGRSFRYI